MRDSGNSRKVLIVWRILRREVGDASSEVRGKGSGGGNYIEVLVG